MTVLHRGLCCTWHWSKTRTKVDFSSFELPVWQVIGATGKGKGLWGWKLALPSLEIRKPIPQCTRWGYCLIGCTAAESLTPAATGWLLLSTKTREMWLRHAFGVIFKYLLKNTVTDSGQGLLHISQESTKPLKIKKKKKKKCCLNAAKLPLLRAHPD